MKTSLVYTECVRQSFCRIYFVFQSFQKLNLVKYLNLFFSSKTLPSAVSQLNISSYTLQGLLFAIQRTTSRVGLFGKGISLHIERKTKNILRNILSKIFRVYSQSFQRIPRIVFNVSHERFLPHSFQIVHLQFFGRRVV